jgi:hypothetical protein
VDVGGLRDRRRFLRPSDSNEELEAPFQTEAKTFSSDSIYGKVCPVLACFLGGQRNIKILWLKSG